MPKVVVIGGGPAGMMAAITAAENGHEVTIIEKMPSFGKKLLIIHFMIRLLLDCI